MRILLVNKYFYRKGGAETYFFALAEGLRALGHEVAFFSMRHPNNEPSRWSRYFVSEKDYVGDISAFRKAKEAATLVYSFESKRRFEALLREFRPDVIHLNNVHRQLTLSILDAPYLRSHAVPVVYTAHDYILLCPAYTMMDGAGKVCDDCLDRRFLHAVNKTCVKGSKAKSGLAFLEAEFLKRHRSYDKIDAIIAPSGFMKRKLDEGGYADRTVAMQNFLTDSQMAMADKVANTGKFSAVAPYFLFFGRLSQEKGILTLVRAFLQARKELPEGWTLRIVGDGPERAAIESLIAHACPQGDSGVELLGYRTGEDLQREVGNARFSVLCSQWRENMPYSGLESLAARTPVIGAEIGGIPELVIEGRTGFAFASGNRDDLAVTLIRASRVTSEQYADMQRHCGAYVVERCRQDAYVRSLQRLYDDVSSGKEGVGARTVA